MIFPLNPHVYHVWGDFPPCWMTLEFSVSSPGGAAHPQRFGAFRGQANRLQGVSRHNDRKDGRARHQRGPQRPHQSWHTHTQNSICSLMEGRFTKVELAFTWCQFALVDLFPDALHHRRPPWVEMTSKNIKSHHTILVVWWCFRCSQWFVNFMSIDSEQQVTRCQVNPVF